jgi:hypothetical protein
MCSLIPFPLSARARLVRDVVDDLQTIHGEEANRFWRDRIGAIVTQMRQSGLADEAIRDQIYNLQDAVQGELRARALGEASTGGAA